ncbi:glycosyltransferase family 25 protein [Sphingobacterium multivorum]|uniref:Glycosyltransferase family 25 (LPS biosynthesis protein) n=1 Tax=Sphingobacterium multivorum TaxID=28454 RepID=A0A2X2JCQ8_SPHMU|nr:glycosyl transferase [Sphingobacterium multivorum]QRQ60044.1 glycosyl transferase [Sphingobacterium multivorum]SPZ92082.1 Glycosyltransferase family 25 (LPS biosynthesis protein) [Sphingobacterium multivorum]
MKENIPVFAINLEDRIDRRDHILKQFAGKSEFEFTLFKAVRHKIGAVGLWRTVYNIVKEAGAKQLPYIIVCEDDHCFTPHYNVAELRNTIAKAEHLCSDILLGGVSHFEDAVQVEQELFWLNHFTGFQFAIIYKRFFQRILALRFNDDDDIDLKISEISGGIHCIYPFISIQEEFGYSDVTIKNAEPGIVEEYFVKSQKRLETLSFLRGHFDNLHNNKENGK